MHAIREVIDRVADTDAPVLLRGETGVGKDVLARAIHTTSTRRRHPFVKVNCAAIPETLLESELFGYERGAFTGADRIKPGLFELAARGTIYLDELGELSRALQPKLLQVLQDFRVARLGGSRLIDVKARVIASTHRDLEDAMARGEFRSDLYHRLNVVEIRVPPLRDRREEIPALASWFLAKFNAEYGRRREIRPEAMARLTGHSWPGNVRELENVVRRLVLLPEDHAAVTRQVAGPHDPARRASTSGIPASGGTLGLREIARRGAQEAEARALTDALTRAHGNRAAAARALRVSYKTLLNKLTQHRLTHPELTRFADRVR